MSEIDPDHSPPPKIVQQLIDRGRNWVIFAVLIVLWFTFAPFCVGTPFRAWWHSSLTPLQRAAFDGDVQMVERLIRNGTPVDAADERGITALGYAVYGQQLATVRRLIELGAAVNHADQDGRTPLIYTAKPPWGKNGYDPATAELRTQIAARLLAGKADVNHQTLFGLTPLHEAVQERNVDLVRLLMAAGANPRLKTSQGYSAGDYATFRSAAVNDPVRAELASTKPSQ